jgi:ATP-dependent RNA helicase DHX37/DHR1
MGRKKSRFYADPSKKNNRQIDSNVEMISGKGPSNVEDAGPMKSNPLNQTKDWSGKRSREFEKYMAKKMKKESRPDMFKRLQELAFDSKKLQSSKNLGVKVSTERAKRVQELVFGQELVVPGRSSYEQLHGDRALKVFFKSAAKAFYSEDDYSDVQDDSGEEKQADSLVGDERDDSVPKDPVTDTISAKPAYFILVNRNPEVEVSRSLLPIYGEEQTIMEAIRQNPVVIICGETGSGKTTQVPQFLYEAGYGCKESDNPGIVGITQPRRVAAVSMARRVAFELGMESHSHVSYQIRYDSSASPETRIKFMTDGILLREIASDFLLTKYSVVILDEAHERNLNTDILIGILSRIVALRNEMAQRGEAKPLRLVIMSATLDVEEFMNPKLFKPLPPLIKVDARQHPVSVHFARRTNSDHVEAAFKVVCKIHGNLPPGGILVFMTGKQEIVELKRRLQQKYPSGAHHFGDDAADKEENAADGPDDEGDDMPPFRPEEETISDIEDADGETSGFDGSEFELDCQTVSPIHIVPLHSLLSTEAQQKVFAPPPEGSRLCVIATNIAETSLTIPNIKYVVDCGKVKQRFYDLQSGSQQYRLIWSSKASAAQRAGRAGRTGPGHCYRLYSTAVFDQQCPDFPEPEIQRVPIESLILQLKMMGIDNVRNFPLPSTPHWEAIEEAEKTLLRLGALTTQLDSGSQPRLCSTKLGNLMALFPLAPRWCRMLVLACQDAMTGNCIKALPLMIALVASLTVGSPFVDQAEGLEEWGNSSVKNSLNSVKLHFAGKPPVSDLLLMLSVFMSFTKLSQDKRRQFCENNYLLEKKMEEILLQYRQITKLVQQNFPESLVCQSLPDSIDRDSREYLRRAIAESLMDRIAERTKFKGGKSNLAAYRLLVTDRPDSKSQQSDSDGPHVVYLHSSSCLSSCPPRYLVYGESNVNEKMTTLKNVTAIEQSWIPQELILASSSG